MSDDVEKIILKAFEEAQDSISLRKLFEQAKETLELDASYLGNPISDSDKALLALTQAIVRGQTIVLTKALIRLKRDGFFS